MGKPIIKFDEERGLWVGVVWTTTDDGRKSRRTVTGTTREQVKHRMLSREVPVAASPWGKCHGGKCCESGLSVLRLYTPDPWGKRRTYGVCLGVLAEMLKSGLCQVCGVQLTPENHAVDHCHGTGRVRGVVCKRCNLGLSFLDRPEWVMAASSFLRSSGHYGHAWPPPTGAPISTGTPRPPRPSAPPQATRACRKRGCRMTVPVFSPTSYCAKHETSENRTDRKRLEATWHEAAASALWDIVLPARRKGA